VIDGFRLVRSVALDSRLRSHLPRTCGRDLLGVIQARVGGMSTQLQHMVSDEEASKGDFAVSFSRRFCELKSLVCWLR
jgi:hypothetical protein